MTQEEFFNNQNDLYNKIKEINKQYTELINEMFPYAEKYIEIQSETQLYYIRCNSIIFEDGYYKFIGKYIYIRGNEFTFNSLGSIDILRNKISNYRIKEVSEENFNNCINEEILKIIHEELE